MLEWNEEKRFLTLEKRGLDFADSALVFAGETYSFPDDRQDYGEPRTITIGFLGGHCLDTERQSSPYYQHEKSK